MFLPHGTVAEYVVNLQFGSWPALVVQLWIRLLDHEQAGKLRQSQPLVVVACRPFSLSIGNELVLHWFRYAAELSTRAVIYEFSILHLCRKGLTATRFAVQAQAELRPYVHDIAPTGAS
eukprot:s1961_g12.t1